LNPAAQNSFQNGRIPIILEIECTTCAKILKTWLMAREVALMWWMKWDKTGFIGLQGA